MKRSTRILAAFALLAAPLGALGGASAAAPTTTAVGEVSPATFGVTCASAATLIQKASRAGAPSYDMPFDGVITSFSTRANSSDKTARLVMVEALTATTFAVRAKSAPMPTLNGVVNTFSVRVPVKAGWKLGATLTGGCGHPGSGTDHLVFSTENVDTNPVLTTMSVGPQRFNLAADLEPDVDADGYGDVSQDACPESAQSVVACPAPETTITKAPKAKSKKRKVTVTFASTVARSSFLVSVDGKAAKEHFSPFKATLKPGKHTISVQAITPPGIVDPTPATTTFTIKKTKRHRR
jgi:hypothetical protein